MFTPRRSPALSTRPTRGSSSLLETATSAVSTTSPGGSTSCGMPALSWRRRRKRRQRFVSAFSSRLTRLSRFYPNWASDCSFRYLIVVCYIYCYRCIYVLLIWLLDFGSILVSCHIDTNKSGLRIGKHFRCGSINSQFSIV